MDNVVKDYWNKYYGNVNPRLLVPSQFAAFAACEIIDKSTAVIDIGCGNGRDANFFAKIGFQVVGIDASKEAIDFCKNNSASDTKFIVGDIEDSNLAENISELVGKSSSLLVYSRFFLHAISAEAENKLWILFEKLCRHNDKIALEFRTHKDESQIKETTSHYRRYIDPTDVLVNASNFGFKCTYYVTGFGYAKYGNDDAHVARLIFERH